MGKVILHVTMSLDGFMAGPNDEMAWVFAYDGGDVKMAKSVMQNLGAVVLGKRTYDVSVENDHMPYGASLKIPQFVVSTESHDPSTHQGLTFKFVTEGVEKAIELAKKAAGEKDISLLGASIDQQALKVGLVDEIVIHLAPIILGAGKRVFDNLGDLQIKLQRTDLAESGQMTDLRFKVLK